MTRRYLLSGIVAGVLAVIPAGATPVLAEGEAPAPATGETFHGTIQIADSEPGTANLRVTVTRWTNEEGRARLAESLKTGGTSGLVKSLSSIDSGFFQIGPDLKMPIRYAVAIDVPEGRRVRIATEKPILFSESLKSANTADFPIGMFEFTLPLEGKGTGLLIPASQVSFDEAGHLELKMTPNDTPPPSKLIDVDRESPRATKTERKEAPKTEKKQE